MTTPTPKTPNCHYYAIWRKAEEYHYGQFRRTYLEAVEDIIAAATDGLSSRGTLFAIFNDQPPGNIVALDHPEGFNGVQSAVVIQVLVMPDVEVVTKG